MKITIALKQLGKKSAILHEQIELGELNKPVNLRSLLSALVVQQVRQFEQIPIQTMESTDNLTLQPFTNDSLLSMMSAGKFHFNVRFDASSIKLDEAISTALQSFEDELFVVFLDDEKIDSLDAEISIEETTVLTLIKLTFLSGRLW